MKVLGIETSCDETAVAVVEDGKKVLSSIVASQVDIHRKFGGVVPELACRAHLELLCPIIKEGLSEAAVKLSDIDGIAVTAGPGLVGALLVGISTAKALSFSLGRPLVGVNHIEAHLYANFMKEEPVLPAIGLVVSGGHSDLIYVKGIGQYELLGRTRDDAVGEAFDKVAKMLGLGYPGGPIIQRIARKGNPEKISFPRPYLPGSLDFSFSGLKTAVLYHIRKHGRDDVEDIAAGFQSATVDVLVRKTFKTAEATRVQTVLLAGGVARNTVLRKRMKQEAMDKGLTLFHPPPELCTDNAVMVAGIGFVKLRDGERSSLSLEAHPDWVLGRTKASPPSFPRPSRGRSKEGVGGC